jgi:hypothetical protein
MNFSQLDHAIGALPASVRRAAIDSLHLRPHSDAFKNVWRSHGLCPRIGRLLRGEDDVWGKPRVPFSSRTELNARKIRRAIERISGEGSGRKPMKKRK